MNIILLEKVRNLGSLGDTVTVKAGYARNYLLPQSKAVRATEANIASFDARRADLEARAQEALSVAQARAESLNALEVKITALTSDEGKLYGSVGAHDLAAAIQASGVDVQKREVLLTDGPIHSIGEYTVSVQVHTDVMAQVKVIVVSSK